MCGIAGFFGADAGAIVKRMTDIMTYRGPDDAGLYEGEVA